MLDPHDALTMAIAAAIEAAFGAEHAGVDPVLRPATNPKFGDYQANVAMPLGKALSRSPRDVAGEIVAHLDVRGLCAEVEVAGPGFINFRLDDAWLAGAVADLSRDERRGVPRVDSPQTIVVDYSGPNVAKEMHVGHLRSTIVGDALARVFRALGHHTIAQNHIGDWGTPFGMLIEHIIDVNGTDPPDELSVADLNEFYQQARSKFDGDPGFAERARARVVALQSGDRVTCRLWALFVDESKRHFRAVYDRLGILLTDDDIAGESSFNDELGSVADELTVKGLAVVDDGALCAFPPGFTGREGEPLPLIVRKSDGGYGYAATDLAAVRHRVHDLHASRLVYVVGAPQATHLSMVFAVAAQAGWLDPTSPNGPEAEHVSFGSVLGSDGKMFKTRRGATIKLAELLDEAVERAGAIVAEKNPDLPPDLRSEVARVVGIGAIKYADLASDRVKDYVFDWDRMLAFDGNTAAYLQNAYVRIRSIFRRAEVEAGSAHEAAVTLSAPAERDLALALVRFPGVVVEVGSSLQPHRMCTYLFDLAQSFTAFYEKCPVLRADDAAQRSSRLALCSVTAGVLETGLALLGIETVDQM